MRRILVPLDGSPLSETAVPYAKALAAGTGCEMSLLSVWEVLPEELEIVGEAHARVLRDQGVGYFRPYLGDIAAGGGGGGRGGKGGGGAGRSLFGGGGGGSQNPPRPGPVGVRSLVLPLDG